MASDHRLRIELAIIRQMLEKKLITYVRMDTCKTTICRLLN